MMASGANQLLPQLSIEQFDTLNLQVRHIEHKHEVVWFGKSNFDKMTAVRTKTIFPLYGFCICMESGFIGRPIKFYHSF